MVFADTHAHLYHKEFDRDRDEMLRRAISEGVNQFFLPNIDSSSIEGMLSMAANYPRHCYPMMGLHPCSVNASYETELALVEKHLAEKKHSFCAVGEIGIDLYWDKTFFREQQDAFRRQIILAKQYGLPIVIHTRNSFHEAFDIVNEQNDASLKGIFHCFSGTLDDANKIIGLGGFKLGIGGVLTFKNGGIDRVVAQVGLEHLVLETDAPYLAPVPHRGKRNESAYIPLVAAKLAELKQLSIEEIAAVTTANSSAVFTV